MAKSQLSVIRIRSHPGNPRKGLLFAGSAVIPVALGRAGIKALKREGDGGTPRGRFRPARLWWRPDRLHRPRTTLPTRRIRPNDAWCEDPEDRRYNRPFQRLPGEAGDRLRRDDSLYDVIVEIDHNTRPRVARLGSAVFIHVARPGFGPTAGCVALRRSDLIALVSRLSRDTRIDVQF